MNNTELYRKIMKGVKRSLNESFGSYNLNLNLKSYGEEDSVEKCEEFVKKYVKQFNPIALNLGKNNLVDNYILETAGGQYFNAFKVNIVREKILNIEDLNNFTDSRIHNLASNIPSNVNGNGVLSMLRLSIETVGQSQFGKYINALYTNKIKDDAEYNKIKNFVIIHGSKNEDWNGNINYDYTISFDMYNFVKYFDAIKAWLS